MPKNILTLLLTALIALGSGLTPSAHAQERGLRLVRDAEIEHILTSYATPLFEAAGLRADAVKIYLVNDATLNAFVANGQRIFVNTGLILAARTPGELVGVLAHETGHIEGGHLSRTRNALANSQTVFILAALAGGALAAASGNVGAASAGLLGGSGAGKQLFLSYSRTQESAADQAGVRLMERTGWSPRGLTDFMKVLEGQELLLGQSGNPYLRSHPLGYERVHALEFLVQRSPLKDRVPPPEVIREYSMMQAKLFGFTRDPEDTFRNWPKSDGSDEARYARAVALMRQAHTDAALRELAPLIEAAPGNPYFYELKGQILMEGGRVEASFDPLRKAAKLSGDETILVLLAGALIATESPEGNAEALSLLKQVVRDDPNFPAAWAQLAIAHGRRGELGLSSLASAEQYLRTGQIAFAKEQVQRALRIVAPETPEYYQAKDLELAIKGLEDRFYGR